MDVEFVSPPPGPKLYLDNDDDEEEPHRFRMMKNILNVGAVELHLMAKDEPANFATAERHAWWRRAMDEEMSAIMENRTWELVNPVAGHRPIGLKWVYKVKKDSTDNVSKHKARLVAKGYVQRSGIDYEEVFAPVAPKESLRLLITLAAHEGWSVHHMDVKFAFLNGELEEVIYVTQPPGFEVKGEEHKVLRLKKALYGLKQAPRAWNARLNTELHLLGFRQSELEHAMYTRGFGKSRFLVGMYIDDLIITGSNEEELRQFKAEMMQHFKMSDLGLLSFYLGIEVRQNSNGITLNQAAYARKILE
jgi:hypothetical protein